MFRITILALLAVLACRSSRATSGPAAGELVLQWRDSAARSVTLRAPAEAHWCAHDSLLEILAIRRDTGLGLVLLPRDSLHADGFPVFLGGVFAPWRPQSSAALRVLSATDLRGYTSTWGQVTLSAVAGQQVSGSFDLRVKLA